MCFRDIEEQILSDRNVLIPAILLLLFYRTVSSDYIKAHYVQNSPRLIGLICQTIVSIILRRRIKASWPKEREK